MMNELKFYAPNPLTLGEDTEEDEGEEQGAEDSITKLLASGLDGEEEDAQSLIDQVMSGVENADREKERRALYDTEMNIEDHKMEAEVESCMTDFYRKPYAGADEPRVSKEEANEHLIPLNYYDNDDGFWDDHI